ncbi:histidine phosphatase family protein [Rhodomicrobium lacus]|jgi:probable phosphoglycerate mutase|uniref:histidine phosphatase family protein n=1 Tax=Rhodomicrobium lacus TaxID=2498452 RepID=UPI0026E1C6B0|nr:histidine phosphatase family protein [Rhodomicrobium lacus]WKW52447.1 histidine phosphatase family protein [Rhodomicrobium lacus]
MPLIYFIRHGQTDYNAARRVQGWLDIPINATGRVQALRNGGVLNELISDKSRFDFVSSPLLRTRQTMEIMRETMGLPKAGYATDDRLKEISFGEWEGMNREEIDAVAKDLHASVEADRWNKAPPAGQSFRDYSAQVLSWLAEIRRDTVVVAHGGTSRVVRAHFMKLPPSDMQKLDVPQDKVLLIEGGTLHWL